ncbi:TIGR03619 family F420-dependent LLM class oxidoreductase [Kutzneria sp. 744]|uniref:TIGR03619 family F420-dependent LLM class oxidoreductase n=1 Tax=Kutzneria sp. (strain 744) TaxID=345341 RepID=UPI0003EEAC0C|nr:TIGR03619 family F420-dependent LLM class oxidoreductase [Kutzneria sp. 744]EWM13249.1 F420-dependent oxidoreductase [Kutzneria sp. 744]
MTKYGLSLPQGSEADLSHDVTTVAREAERLGYDSLWVYERVLFPVKPNDGMYGVPGLAWSETYQFNAEPLTVLAAAAAVTQTVKLGTCLLVAPLHQPVRLARTLATIDQLSGGRMVAGFGSGWSSDEYRSHGAELRNRGRDLEATIDACRTLWGPNPVSYRDSRTVVDNAFVTPKPVDSIPILVGGGSAPAALDRIARKADGWIPSGMGAEAIGQTWQRIRELADGHGRDADALRLVPLIHVYVADADISGDRTPFQGSPAQLAEDVAALTAVGADEVILYVVNGNTARELVDRAGALVERLPR